MTIHTLKTWTEFFQLAKSHKKNFELRENDRNFQVNDELILQEFDPIKGEYTGDHMHALITYILPSDNPFHDLGNKVILALKYDY